MQVNSDVMVLVSVGQHPLSGRPRRAERDAKALELALSLDGIPSVVLAGDPDSAAVREYLGMGLPKLNVLKQPEQADTSVALCEFVKSGQPSLVLCGARAEQGESSGMVPYLVAKALNAAVVPEVVTVLSRSEDAVEVLQALAGGQRRKLRATLPAVLIASQSAPDARQSAFTKARDGLVKVLEVAVVDDTEKQGWQWQPAKSRPKRTKTVAATASSRDRFRAATAAQASSGGEVLRDVPANEAAEKVLKLLKEKGVL
ncbi:electron transfer flavoprotein subunit beta [Enterovibrio paralichthyis]|uniref:electron transfer flavoprotein subunit beta n=1 Tax=Enterovibrio paralichthyis TaxID=2853805 RepID=UPI001C47D97E|nr:electron transfer flavoprotein subunit beta [Enterovibrio paralichthyis]MBV7297408.1 electron transfer flavoprotein subunit beta [Enterovibrio paralichthyis]